MTPSLRAFSPTMTASQESAPGFLWCTNGQGWAHTVKKRCGELAKLGYAAFGADIYGKGI
jgi:hypothetical protein